MVGEEMQLRGVPRGTLGDERHNIIHHLHTAFCEKVVYPGSEAEAANKQILTILFNLEKCNKTISNTNFKKQRENHFDGSKGLKVILEQI